MFSELFCPPFQTELEDLEESTKKKACTSAAAYEEAMLKQEGLPDTSVTKTIYPTSMSMSHTIGILLDYFPVSHQAKEPCKATGKLVIHTYYLFLQISESG